MHKPGCEEGRDKPDEERQVKGGRKGKEGWRDRGKKSGRGSERDLRFVWISTPISDDPVAEVACTAMLGKGTDGGRQREGGREGSCPQYLTIREKHPGLRSPGIFPRYDTI